MVTYSLIALSLILLVRMLPGSGYSPGHVWGYTWAFAWACQAFLGAGFLLDSNIVVLVASGNVAFILAAYIASSRQIVDGSESSASRQRQEFQYASTIRSVIGMVLLLAAFITLDFGLRKLGHLGIKSVFAGSFTDFATSLRDTKASVAFFATPPEITASATLMTCVAVLAGIESALPRSRAAMALIGGTLVLAFITSAGTGVRNYLFVAILVLISAHLAAKIYLNGASYKPSGRAFIVGGAMVLGFLAWVVVVQSARRGDYSFEQVAATLDYLRAWFAGYVPALSQWTATLDLYGNLADNSIPAANLLRGILGPLGLASGEGFDTTTATVDIGNGATSNAMTVFRWLLPDFGFAGSLLACAVAGLVSQTVYQRVLAGSTFFLVPLAASYAVIIYSFNGWFFTYGSRLLGVALALIIVVLSQKLRTRVAELPPTASDRTCAPDKFETAKGEERSPSQH
jgi:oligosaccharide repeat unit polymerase